MVQNGDNFSYSAEFIPSPGAMATTGEARGTVEGRTAYYRFTDSTGRVLACTATVASDYKSMQERCIDPIAQESGGQVVTLVRT